MYGGERTWQLNRQSKTFSASAGDTTLSGYTITFSVQIDGGTIKEFAIALGDEVKQLTIAVQEWFR
ncbi:hypothetical protein [Streptomyces goshikiensis]|uniref:hypothetical protein n=1 Tax=Streptomyces goshikiensis TaxID=1942 RepID=UPI0033D998A3